MRNITAKTMLGVLNTKACLFNTHESSLLAGIKGMTYLSNDVGYKADSKKK